MKGGGSQFKFKRAVSELVVAVFFVSCLAATAFAANEQPSGSSYSGASGYSTNNVNTNTYWVATANSLAGIFYKLGSTTQSGSVLYLLNKISDNTSASGGFSGTQASNVVSYLNTIKTNLGGSSTNTISSLLGDIKAGVNNLKIAVDSPWTSTSVSSVTTGISSVNTNLSSTNGHLSSIQSNIASMQSDLDSISDSWGFTSVHTLRQAIEANASNWTLPRVTSVVNDLSSVKSNTSSMVPHLENCDSSLSYINRLLNNQFSFSHSSSGNLPFSSSTVSDEGILTDINSESLWESGAYQNSNGSPFAKASNIRLRSSFALTNDVDSISSDNGFQFSVLVFSNGSFVGSSESLLGTRWLTYFTPGSLSSDSRFDSFTYLLNVRKSDDSNITTAAFSNIHIYVEEIVSHPVISSSFLFPVLNYGNGSFSVDDKNPVSLMDALGYIDFNIVSMSSLLFNVSDNNLYYVYDPDSGSFSSSPVRSLSGFFNSYFKDFNVYLSKLQYMLANDDDIEIKKQQQSNSDFVKDNILSGSDSSSSVGTGSLGSMKDLGDGVHDLFDTGVSPSAVLDVLGSSGDDSPWAWFTQATADDLDSTGSSGGARKVRAKSEPVYIDFLSGKLDDLYGILEGVSGDD